MTEIIGVNGTSAANTTVNQTVNASFAPELSRIVGEHGGKAVSEASSGHIIQAIGAWTRMVGLSMSHVVGVPGQGVNFLGLLFGLLMPAGFTLIILTLPQNPSVWVRYVLKAGAALTIPMLVIVYLAALAIRGGVV